MTLKKTIISLLFIIVLAGVMTSCSTGDKVARAERQAAIARQVSDAIMNRDFTVSVRWMKPLYGQPKQVSYGYELTVQDTTVISYLPYIGEAYNVPYGGGKALNFTGETYDYTVQQVSHDLSRIIFTVTNDEDTYLYQVEVFSNGKATIDVYARQRNPISFEGEMVFKNQPN